MSAPLRLSHNELSALLKYAFQGLFGHSQDWGALAENVLWLETHGFYGMAMLMDGLRTETLHSFEGTVSDTPSGFKFNFEGGSLLMGLPMIVDFAIARTRNKGECTIEVVSAEHIKALISVEAAVCRSGLYACACHDKGKLSCSLNPQANIVSHEFSESDIYYQQCLNDGIMVNRADYKALNDIADRTLVEASEASRQGAGE
jgi:hypothetical protein